MDPLLDDFISYEYQENPIQGGLFDPSYFLTSPFSDNSNHPSIFTNFLPESPYNLQSPPDMPQTGSNVQENTVPLQQGQAETSARNKRQGGSKSPKEGLDLSKLYIPPALQEELGTKLNVQSKKISKQTKSTECNDSEESADQKKMSQMLKNRISAQNSRDKKKIYLQQLEGENMVLKQEKVLLLDRIQRIESDYARVLKENEVLKNNGSYICSQCGCSGGFENIIDPVPSVDNNTLPTPGLSRAASRSGAFGFSYSFTTVLLLIFMMTSSEGEQQDSSSVSLPPIINTNTRILDNYDTYKDLSQTQDLSPLSTAPGSVILEESFESQYGSLSYNGMPILSQFESMMDDFDANHEKFYEAYELNNHSMVNLSQPIRNATALSEPADLSSNSSGKAFLSKPIVKSRNKTSTLFCPTGFEFFRSSEEEYGGGYSDFSFLGNKASKYSPQKRTLSLDKADYVQLLIPRNSISRLSVSGNSSEIDRSTGYNNSNDEGVIQVWAKIFAVKGLSRTF